MTAPCEYCGAPVEYAEAFFRLSVMPCCQRCRWVPLLAGASAMLMLIGVAVAFAVGAL